MIIEIPVARPSSPSVRFMLFAVAIKVPHRRKNEKRGDKDRVIRENGT